MPCYHPLKIFYTGRKTENGGKEGVIVSHEVRALSLRTAEKKCKNLKLGEMSGIRWVNGEAFLTDFDEIPCGKCIGCLLDHSRDWATRCVLEARKYGQDNAFLTLTYDDEHLPEDNKPTVREMQLFLKRLRKEYGSKIRIAYCGELGGTTGRAHYHAILMNIKITDQLRWSDALTWSPKINKLWGKGNVTIGKVTFDSCAYVARYMLKKIGDNDSFFQASRRPGLGYDHLKQHGEIFALGGIYNHDGKTSKLKLPKYFKKKLLEEDEVTAEYLKNIAKSTASLREIAEMEAYAGIGSMERIREYKEDMQKHRAKKFKRAL